MPLKNIQLVPVKCPKCGADMQVPDKLDKLHCIYCGSAFLISENAPLVSTRSQDNSAAIENYIKLMFLDLKRNWESKSLDFGKAGEYKEKAMELDFDKTMEVIKIHLSEIYPKYRGVFIDKVKEYLACDGVVDEFKEHLMTNKISSMFSFLNAFFGFCYRDMEQDLDPGLLYYDALTVLHQSERTRRPKLQEIYRSQAENLLRQTLKHDPEYAGAKDALRKMEIDPGNLTQKK